MRYMYTETESEGNKKRKKDMESDDAAAIPGVKWGKILPKMVVRILLVEADDSTRHIIAALLRKCSYRVAAVSDGLKAWELLKGNAHNIDLVLTEVNLQSISGYALLTLIMEHEVCKNIPIISMLANMLQKCWFAFSYIPTFTHILYLFFHLVMSSHDSIGTVYRCMLRGAADFLVKPIRKNELKNLWQHVWRRQASNGGAQGLLHETAVQQKACSDHSSTHKACVQRSRECFHISSDSPSSSRKPVSDNEGETTEDVSSSTQQNWNTCLRNDEDSRKEELRHEATVMLRMSENDTGGAAARIDANTTTKGGDTTSPRSRDHTSDDYPTPRQAVDLIGAFDSHDLNCDDRSPDSISSRNNVGFSSLLDLSLTRSHPRSSVSQYIDENNRLNHSDASVFLNREMQSGQSISPKTSNQQDVETYSDKNLIAPGASTTPHNHVLSNYCKSGEAEFGHYSPQKRLQPLTIPVEGARFEQLRSVYSSMIVPVHNTPSGISPFQCPGSRNVNPFLQLNCENRSPPQLPSLTDQNNSHATNYKEGGENRQKPESAMACQRFISGTHQSTNSSSSGGAINHIHASCGTNRNNLVPAVKLNTPAECREEAISLPHDMKSHREAAVTKFRLKRKDRCFDKKVRYESRKQLAEQRPRVKGQFVRQVPREPLVRQLIG